MMWTESDKYQGPERRQNRVFVTRNSEYHCHGGTCVAVRDLRTGEFYKKHRAIGRRMTASIRFSPDGYLQGLSPPGDVHVGEQLCFRDERSDDSHELITSSLSAVERPPK